MAQAARILYVYIYIYALSRYTYTYLFTKEITRSVSTPRILILGRKTISRRNTPDHNAPFVRLLALIPVLRR